MRPLTASRAQRAQREPPVWQKTGQTLMADRYRQKLRSPVSATLYTYRSTHLCACARAQPPVFFVPLTNALQMRPAYAQGPRYKVDAAKSPAHESGLE